MGNDVGIECEKLFVKACHDKDTETISNLIKKGFEINKKYDSPIGCVKKKN
jgi:hypothetical protein